RDFTDAVREVEQERGRTPEGSLRISFFDSAQSVFDALIGLLVDNHEYEEAFSYSERARARALLENFESASHFDSPKLNAVLTAESIVRRLPHGLALVEYRLLPGRVVAWVVAGGRIQAAQLPGDATKVKNLATRVTEGFAKG